MRSVIGTNGHAKLIDVMYEWNLVFIVQMQNANNSGQAGKDGPQSNNVW